MSNLEAALAIMALIVALAGVVFGAYIKICCAIRREDRVKGALRSAPTSHSAQSARDLVGISSSKWD
jgi:hypothetical protein